MTELKSEIRARLEELERVDRCFRGAGVQERLHWDQVYQRRRTELLSGLEAAPEDMASSVIRSHKAVCAAKNMDEKAAYGQEPALYYGAAIAGEAGECLNKIVKALRNGDDKQATKAAVVSELPDIFIYSYVLARVLDLDVDRLVAEKVDVVIQRAESGYYGGKLKV